MPKKLDLYILGECVPTFLLSLGVFSFVLLVQRMSQLFDLVIAKGVPALEVLRLFLLALPTLLPLLLPISLLLAVLLAMGRLSSDGEIVAMRASGVSLAQNLRAVTALSLAVTLLASAVSLWALPESMRLFRQTLYDAVMRRIDVSTEAGTFTEIGRGLTLYTQASDPETGELSGLFLHSRNAPFTDTVLFAPRGRVAAAPEGLVLEVSDAELQSLASRDKPLQRIRVAKSRFVIPIPEPVAEEGKIDERPTSEVAALAYGPKADRVARLELNKRLSLPFSCLFLGLLGGSLGLHHARVGKGRGILLCLVLLLLYYALLTTSNTLGRRTQLNPELVIWFPDAVLAALAGIAFWYKNRERPLPLEAWLSRLIPRRKAAGGAT